MRIDKLLSELGICSRKESALLVKKRALTVDGKRWNWQPLYALKESGQFSTDEAGYVYLLEQDLTRRLVHGEALLHVIGE